MSCKVAELGGLSWSYATQGDFRIVLFKHRTKNCSSLMARLFKTFPRLCNLSRDMVSLSGYLNVWRSCETRGHCPMEGWVQNKRKEWVALKSPYAIPKLSWKNGFRWWFRFTDREGRRVFVLIGRRVVMAIDDEFKKVCLTQMRKIEYVIKTKGSYTHWNISSEIKAKVKHLLY